VSKHAPKTTLPEKRARMLSDARRGLAWHRYMYLTDMADMLYELGNAVAADRFTQKAEAAKCAARNY